MLSPCAFAPPARPPARPQAFAQGGSVEEGIDSMEQAECANLLSAGTNDAAWRKHWAWCAAIMRRHVMCAARRRCRRSAPSRVLHKTTYVPIRIMAVRRTREFFVFDSTL